MSDRVMSRDLTPGTKLRWTGRQEVGRTKDIAVLHRRKKPTDAGQTPFHPGWWCVGGGGLADSVIDDENSKWEVVAEPLKMTLPDGTVAEYVDGTLDGLTESGDLACTVTIALDGELHTTKIAIPRDVALANWRPSHIQHGDGV